MGSNSVDVFPSPPANSGADLLELAVLEIGSGRIDWHLGLMLVLSGIGSLIVFALAVSAFRRRRSLPYLLITAALGALVLRPIVGTGTALGYVSMTAHHTIEHGLDVLIASLLIAAVLSVGSLESELTNDADDEFRGGVR